MLALIGVVAAQQPAQAASTSYSSNCDKSITVYGAVGDTLVFTLGSACPSHPETGIWNINDAQNESGFLELVSYSNQRLQGGYYLYRTTKDWYVSSNGSGATTITATIKDTNGKGVSLTKGATLAWLYTNADEFTFPIVYGGPSAPATGGGPTTDYPTVSWTCAAGVPSPSAAGVEGLWRQVSSEPAVWALSLNRGVFADGSPTLTYRPPADVCSQAKAAQAAQRGVQAHTGDPGGSGPLILLGLVGAFLSGAYLMRDLPWLNPRAAATALVLGLVFVLLRAAISFQDWRTSWLPTRE